MKKMIEDATTKAIKTLEILTNEADLDAIKALNPFDVVASVALLTGDHSLFYRLANTNDNVAMKQSIISKMMLVNAYVNVQLEKNAISDVFEHLDADNLQKALNSIVGIVINAIVNESGLCCDKNGLIIEDKTFHLMSGASRPSWGVQQYRDNSGNKVSPTDYDNYTDAQKAECTSHRIMYIDGGNGVQHYVDQYKTDWVREGIRRNVARNPDVIIRLACEIYDDKKNNRHGLAYDHRDIILDVIRELPSPEYSNNDFMEQLSGGNIKSYGELMIAVMETLLVVSDATLSQAAEVDILRYVKWARILSKLTDESKRQEYIHTEDMENYRDKDGKKLKGLDDQGKVITSDTATVGDRKSYINYLGFMVSEKLFTAIIAGGILRPRSPEVTNKVNSLYAALHHEDNE